MLAPRPRHPFSTETSAGGEKKLRHQEPTGRPYWAVSLVVRPRWQQWSAAMHPQAAALPAHPFSRSPRTRRGEISLRGAPPQPRPRGPWAKHRQQERQPSFPRPLQQRPRKVRPEEEQQRIRPRSLAPNRRTWPQPRRPLHPATMAAVAEALRRSVRHPVCLRRQTRTGEQRSQREQQHRQRRAERPQPGSQTPETTPAGVDRRWTGSSGRFASFPIPLLCPSPSCCASDASPRRFSLGLRPPATA